MYKLHFSVVVRHNVYLDFIFYAENFYSEFNQNHKKNKRESFLKHLIFSNSRMQI